jgi:hypothetical protein
MMSIARSHPCRSMDDASTWSSFLLEIFLCHVMIFSEHYSMVNFLVLPICVSLYLSLSFFRVESLLWYIRWERQIYHARDLQGVISTCFIAYQSKLDSWNTMKLSDTHRARISNHQTKWNRRTKYAREVVCIVERHFCTFDTINWCYRRKVYYNPEHWTFKELFFIL